MGDVATCYGEDEYHTRCFEEEQEVMKADAARDAARHHGPRRCASERDI